MPAAKSMQQCDVASIASSHAGLSSPSDLVFIDSLVRGEVAFDVGAEQDLNSLLWNQSKKHHCPALP